MQAICKKSVQNKKRILPDILLVLLVRVLNSLIFLLDVKSRPAG